MKKQSSTSKLHSFDTMSDAGMVVVTGYGQENVYFTFTDKNGNVCNGYCKCL